MLKFFQASYNMKKKKSSKDVKQIHLKFFPTTTTQR